jgi:hypothetical protein
MSAAILQKFQRFLCFGKLVNAYNDLENEEPRHQAKLNLGPLWNSLEPRKQSIHKYEHQKTIDSVIWYLRMMGKSIINTANSTGGKIP